MHGQTLALTIAMMASLALPGAARAGDDTYWQAGTGDWSTGSNWTNGEPNSDDYAHINNGGTAEITLSGEKCEGLYLGYDSGESGQVQMGAGSLWAEWGEYIGYYGTGTFTQTGGTNTVNSGDWGFLSLGVSPGSSGTYELSGTGQLSADNEYIGDHGTGTFTQTGGTNTVGGSHIVDGFLYIGDESGSSGMYELSGTGQLSARFEVIGFFGTGTFTQTGGTNTVSGSGGFLILGVGPGSSGTYELSGTGQLSADCESIGFGGTFTQTGGINTILYDLCLGMNLDFDNDSGPSGMYTISGGQLSADCVYVGDDREGTFRVVGDDAIIDFDSYTQDAGGDLYSIFDSDGLSLIDVLGIAELAGDWYIEDPGLDAPFGTFDVLTAGGGILGSFSNVYLPDADWSWGIDGGTLWIGHVPEPATLSLLAIGSLAMLRRKRQ